MFCGKDGVHLSTRHVQRRLRNWRQSAGISRQVTAHSCRHKFALQIYEQTHDLLLVQAALGHASLGSSVVYARVSAEQVRAAVASR